MYIDPGIGSMIIQSLVAIIPMIGAGIIAFRRKLFKSKYREEENINLPTENDDFEEI